MVRIQLRVCRWVLGLTLVVGAAAGGSLAQQQGELAPATSVAAELRGLASRAGVVFVGQVAKIEAKDEVVEITFTVQQPVLGLLGGSYVMREWAGRWTGGQQHFRVGQSAMFFLHAPSSAGLSSPVEGMIGVVPLAAEGANGAALLDVRWLATRVRNAQRSSLAGVATSAIALADGVAVTRSWKGEGVAEPKEVRLPEGVLGQAAIAAKPGPPSMQEVGDAQR